MQIPGRETVRSCYSNQSQNARPEKGPALSVFHPGKSACPHGVEKKAWDRSVSSDPPDSRDPGKPIPGNPVKCTWPLLICRIGEAPGWQPRENSRGIFLSRMFQSVVYTALFF
jgi:hypothetical protein